MKIYIVSHYWDNGESYEDYRDYEDHFHFSTLKKATTFFWDKVNSDYEGRYTLISKELDTQEEEKLEESAWVNCTSSWPYDTPEYYEPKDEEYYEPEDNSQTLDDSMWEEQDEEEQRIIDEWLTHKGENYKVFKEMEEAQLMSLLKSLNTLL